METYNNSNHIKENDENLLRQFVSNYLPYWPMFVIAIAIAMGIGFIYLRYTTPIYEANATIIIKDEKKGNEDSKLMESLDQISSKKIVENEIEIIQSRTLMVNVVKSLGLYAPIYEKGKVHNFSAYIKSPVRIEAANPDSIIETKKINLLYDKKHESVILNNKYTYPINQIVVSPFGLLKFVPNKYYNSSEDSVDHQFYFTLENPIGVASGLLGGLKVDASSKLSSVIDLSFRDAVPQRAEDILNELIASYDEAAISEKDKLARNTLAFVEGRLNVVAHDLDSIEKKVQQYKSGKGAVDIGTQGQIFLSNVSSNDQKIGEVNAQLSILNQVQKSVTDRGNNESIVPSTIGISDPLLSQLLERLNNLDLDYAKLKKTVGENNPNLMGIADQINKIKPSILQNIESQQQNLNVSRQNLYATNGTYNSMLQSVPQKERQLLDISREQATKNSIYSFLLQKREESELSYAATVSDHRLIDSAQAGDIPVSPKRMLIYILSVVGCLGVCFAIIIVRESLTGKVLYRHEIESRTLIPIIGEVAFDKSKT
ncbi:MAG: GumC family protein, partial [Ferruginibacter sp.]